ncbi:TRAP transporter large permease [Pseudodonghicola flavimaris]|uniref:TRAP transporter large permease protein n=1 Tax=Pseudodonghicola flavimaris TaxID=3050036 RepID=A0ABT7F0B0_9RHOB|nr:TRAP transporter large permease [Pseudodonghicola flavimaris]MDK3018033.1 TRAP transporter large permease [Pseudodonghicola flavimaris]
MEWVQALAVMLGGVIVLIMLGLPVVMAFMTANLIGALLYFGGEIGIMQMIRNLRPSVANYNMAPIPLFVLMGEIMLQTGMAKRSIEAIDKLIARVPGRLSIVAVLGGTSFAALSGSSVANAAIVGRTLLPEMKSLGYANTMSIGPATAVGGIAVLIPPSALAVILGSLAHISINELLLSGIIPGVMMMVAFLAYIMIRCTLNPALAPMETEREELSFGERVMPVVKNVLPLMLIFVAVVGAILGGFATPTESAAIGAVASFIAGLVYRRLTVTNFLAAFRESLKFSAMILFIICCSGTFSQILAFTGATEKLTRAVIEGSNLTPFVIVVLMLALLIVLGFFMESASIIMLTVPIFFPILSAVQVDLLWFGLMMMVALEIGLCTPPFGILLFVVQGVLNGRVSMGAIYHAVFPFITLQLLVLAIILLFPGTISWLPALLQQ